MNLSVMLAGLLFGAQAAPPTPAPERVGTPGCRPYAGLEQLWANRSLRWIVVGELHGTWEMPAAFRDIVCNAAAAKRPIVVAVERSETEQADIDTFMKSNGGEDTRAALLRNHAWQDKGAQDGRSSRAYLHLLNHLRVMHHAGAIEKVVAFQPASGDMANYEAEMAKRLQSAASTKETLVLAFVGNFHAMRIPMRDNKPAAAYLPSAETFTINLESSGGTAWNCAATGPSPPSGSFSDAVAAGRISCGPQKLGGTSSAGAPRLEILNDPKAPYDGLLFFGGPASASPPAVVQVDAAPKS